MKHADGGPPNRGLANQMDAAPSEMVCPTVISGVEQFCHCAGLRVYAGQICAFVQVAVNTGQCEIFQVVTTAVRLSNDMLDMKGCQRGIILVESAILTAITRAASSAGSVGRVHRLRFVPIS